jgi:HSP20 family protein
MPQAKTDREYHSYLRTFCGDFMEVSRSADRSLSTAQTNVVETENSYRIQVALPGFRKDQIQLRVEDDILSISAEVKTRNKQEHEKYHKQEIFSSSFQRSILLPENVNDEYIKASFRDGLLNIELPKSDHPIKSSLEISIR